MAEKIATREAYGKALAALPKNIPTLSASTQTSQARP